MPREVCNRGTSETKPRWNLSSDLMSQRGLLSLTSEKSRLSLSMLCLKKYLRIFLKDLVLVEMLPCASPTLLYPYSLLWLHLNRGILNDFLKQMSVQSGWKLLHLLPSSAEENCSWGGDIGRNTVPGLLQVQYWDQKIIEKGKKRRGWGNRRLL